MSEGLFKENFAEYLITNLFDIFLFISNNKAFMSEKEIQNLSEHILGNIEALSNEEKADFITELAQHAESHLLNESK